MKRDVIKSECIACWSIRPEVTVFMQLKLIEKACQELAENKNTPDDLRIICKDTSKLFRSSARRYASTKEFAAETKAASVHHLEEALYNLELITKGVGAGFTTKFVKMCVRNATNLLNHAITRSRRKAYRLKAIRNSHG